MSAVERHHEIKFNYMEAFETFAEKEADMWRPARRKDELVPPSVSGTRGNEAQAANHVYIKRD